MSARTRAVAEILPPVGVAVLAGPLSWAGALATGQSVDLLLRIEVT